jgi:hypothetical protein
MCGAEVSTNRFATEKEKTLPLTLPPGQAELTSINGGPGLFVT